jgi:hypothetical protein
MSNFALQVLKTMNTLRHSMKMPGLGQLSTPWQQHHGGPAPHGILPRTDGIIPLKDTPPYMHITNEQHDRITPFGRCKWRDGSSSDLHC